MSGGKPAKYRERPRVNFKRWDDNYREDHYGRREPYVVQERPFEELSCYQKKLIIVVCRVFEQYGAQRMIEELDKLQYCSLETALRVAREGGYEPQKEETTMPKAIMTEEQIVELINLYNNGMKPAELAERFGFDNRQIINKIAKAKINDKYKHLFNDTAAEEQDKRFEEIIDSIDAGAKPKEPEQTENDIDRAAEAIENYLEEKRLTGDITETEARQELPKMFTATGEGLIEAVDGMLLIEGQDIVKEISEQLAENFLGSFYGSVTVHFEVLPERKVLRFNVG